MIKELLSSLLRLRFYPLIAWLTLAASAAGFPSAAVQTPSEAPYRYLAIGNSITRHPECVYWWSEAGMAASTPEQDYFHLVTNYLTEKHASVAAEAINYVEWEKAVTDKASTYSIIDPYLSEDIDLITVQLSENARMNRGLERSFKDLLRHIRKKCPNAQVILVDDFWSDAKSAAKKKAAESLKIPFADLSDIRGKEEYKQTVGGAVYGSDGEIHFIDLENVANHPNDAGMEAIAQAIIRQIEKTE